MTFSALVMRAAGTNCDGETVAALRSAGAEVDLHPIHRLIAAPNILERYRLLVLPGGFTYGDDVASAAVLSYTIQERLLEPLNEFVAAGRFVLGICNGFQVLVRLGLLPGGRGRAALLTNRSGYFEDRWVRLLAGPNPGPWLEPGREYLLPVAHAEGRFEWFPEVEGEELPARHIALTYVGEGETRYPANPNGSHRDIAGIINSAGNVLGLMPHPERFIRPEHHPWWTRYRGPQGSPPREGDLPVPLGLDLFRRVVRAG